MYGKQQLTVLGPALLAVIALGPASISHASATPSSVRAVAADVSHNGAAADDQPPRGGYQNGYRDGYRAASQDCRRRGSFHHRHRMSDYDRGWLAELRRRLRPLLHPWP
ncbi:hypothetical protein ACFQX6_56050 [Streptosporangium lutulentum]